MPFLSQPPPRAGLHYRLSGTFGAPWLLFLNSLATDMRLWDAVIERIGGRFRILTVDQRGHGLSDAPPGPWTLGDLTDDLLALLDHLRIGQCAVCGLSVGGLIAQDLARRAPERLSAVVFSNTGLRIGTTEVWTTRIAAVREGGMAAVAEATMERWFTAAFRADPARVAPWHHMVARTPAAGFLETAAVLRDADLTAAAPQIRTPALVIGGAEDGGTPPDLARALAAALPNADLDILPGAAHLPCVEDPDAYAVRLTTFLTDTARGR